MKIIPYAEMTDSELHKEAFEISSLIKEKDDELERLSKLNIYSHKNPMGTLPKDYFTVIKEKQELAKGHREILEELDKRRKSKAKTQTKVFINSDGEATKREITSLSYIRYQKRLEKQIDQMLQNR